MLNRAVLMGRLTADPEAKQTPNGISVATFTLAVSRNYDREQVDFVNIVAWRQTADFVNRYFKKGQLVAVEGSIQSRSYTDKNGNKRFAVEVVAEQVHFAGAKQAEPHGGSSIPQNDLGEYAEPSFQPEPEEDATFFRSMGW